MKNVTTNSCIIFVECISCFWFWEAKEVANHPNLSWSWDVKRSLFSWKQDSLRTLIAEPWHKLIFLYLEQGGKRVDICYSSGIWLSQLYLYLQALKRGILLNLHYTTLFEYLQVLSCWHGVWAFYLLRIHLYCSIQELFAVEIEACVDHTFP